MTRAQIAIDGEARETEMQAQVTIKNAEDHYLDHVDAPYGGDFAATVGRFQEGFLEDRVCRDLDEAFAKAVDATLRLLPVIIARNA